MKIKLLFLLAVVGIIAGLISANLYRIESKAQPPAFSPASNPYSRGIYTNGIIESYQENGANINIFPEVSGVVLRIPVLEGATVRKGEILLQMDDSVQRAAAEQQKAQAEAALAALEALRAKPRKEDLEVSRAQADYAAANLKTFESQLEKLRRASAMDPRAVSKDQLDNAENAVNSARANLEVARKQLELTKAGAWTYDIRGQERQYEALLKAQASSMALLDKYTIRAPVDGVILAINAAPGSLITTQGAYGTYTGGYNPVIVMANSTPYLGVRCYIDEILIPRLPPASQFGARVNARMFLRGTDISIPLEFDRVQPYVTPKIQLSNQRAEKVDLRVLPVLFKFKPPDNTTGIYPGQLVDVYIEAK